MKKICLGIIALFVVFAMGACGEDMEFDIPCVEEEQMDSCEELEKECNLAVPFGSLCDYIPIGFLQDKCVQWIDRFLDDDEGWTNDSGTCQDLMDIGGACAEDADCMETLNCDLDLNQCEKQ